MFINTANAQGIDPTAAGQIAVSGADQLFQMGAVGIFCVILVAFIIYMHRSHREERKEWREDAAKREEEYKNSANRVADAISQLSRDIYQSSHRGNGPDRM